MLVRYCYLFVEISSDANTLVIGKMLGVRCNCLVDSIQKVLWTRFAVGWCSGDGEDCVGAGYQSGVRLPRTVLSDGG